MSDVTIPADEAKAFAKFIREIHTGSVAYTTYEGLKTIANRLDPPVPSLRDEIAGVYSLGETLGTEVADSVLAVVRRHVETLPKWSGDAVCLADVRALLGVDTDE